MTLQQECFQATACRILLCLACMVMASSCDAAVDSMPVPANSSVWRNPTNLPTEIQPLASRSLLLSATKIDDRIIAVGERGHVLVSNNGEDWKQIAAVPTRASFTAVTAIVNSVWAVGHDGVIIHSADAGEHWQLQHSQSSSNAGASETDLAQDRPLLDVLFLDADNGFAIGAYSWFLRTHDGGKTWNEQTITVMDAKTDPEKKDEADQKNWTFSKQDLKLSQESDPHLNGIAQTGDGSLFIAAERGTAFRSHDKGESWERLQLPYEGSMFGVLGFEDRHVVVFGLRGNVYESFDLGDHWEKVETHTELSLMGGHRLADAGFVLVGANGLVLVRNRAKEALHAYSAQSVGVIATVLPVKDSEFVLVGENGVSRFSAKQPIAE